VPTRAGAIDELGHVFRTQTAVVEFPLLDDALLDVVGPLPRLGLAGVLRQPLQGLPLTCRQILGNILQVRRGIEAKQELMAGLGPTVQMRALREVGIAAKQHAPEAGFSAEGVGDVEDVIGLMIVQMDLEQMEAIFDGLDQPELPDEGMHGTDAAVRDAAGSVSDL
jgi:hypothetical protein